MPHRCRRFTLLDAMILIAATAAGLGYYKAVRDNFPEPFRLNGLVITGYSIPIPNHFVRNVFIRVKNAWSVVQPMLPMLLFWSMAILALRLRRPRPPLRSLLRQPGMVALSCIGIALVANISLFLLKLTIAALDRGWRNTPGYFLDSPEFIRHMVPAEPIGQAVLTTWAILVLGGRWRREPGWIDGAGVGVGVAWLAVLAHYWIGFRIEW